MKKKVIPKARRVRILKKKLFKIWAEITKLQQGGYCQICKSDKFLNSHHLISRNKKDTALKWDTKNAICICALHHKWCNSISPHRAPLQFFEWFRAKYPNKHKYLLEHAEDTKIYTEEELITLLEEMKTKLNKLIVDDL